MEKSVCYYTIDHPLVSKKFGGAELQLYLIGKELQKKGWRVHYLVDDDGQPEIVIREGQVLHKVQSTRRISLNIAKAVPFLFLNAFATFDHPFFSRVLGSFDASIYHQRGSNIATGYFAHHAKKKRKPFVFSIASIDDCTLKGKMWGGNISEYLLRSLIKKRLYLYGLENASAIIATANYLRKEMEKLMPKADVRLIPSGHPVPQKIPEKGSSPFAIWVGRTVAYKFPLQFIELAERLPNHKFLMVGAFPEKEWAGRSYDVTRAVESARQLKNLEILGFQPLEKVNELIARASVLVDTSDSAGFPNTFIQAWLRKTPVASLNIDPDEVLCREKIGFHAHGNFERLAEAVCIMLEDRKAAKKTGVRAFEYAKKHHDIRVTGRMHDELYRELIE